MRSTPTLVTGGRTRSDAGVGGGTFTVAVGMAAAAGRAGGAMVSGGLWSLMDYLSLICARLGPGYPFKRSYARLGPLACADPGKPPSAAADPGTGMRHA